MSSKALRLTFAERIGSLRFRRYQHDRHGVVETLTKDTVTYVRPVFGLLKPDDKQHSEVAKFRAKKPKHARKRLGLRLVDVCKRKSGEPS
jgi:hypothetical protein